MKIAVWIPGQSWGDINPTTFDKGLGGREVAAVTLAMEWGKLGHEVCVYAKNELNLVYPFDRKLGRSGRTLFFDNRHISDDLEVNDFDVLLSWEDPSIFMVEAAAQVPLKVCGMQCAHIDVVIPDETIPMPDLYVALSPWHADFLKSCNPDLPPVAVMPNCVDLSRFPQRVGRATGGPARFMYASSPDRGLVHLLRDWHKYRALFPDCTLSVFYGVEAFVAAQRWSHASAGEMALDIEHLLGQEGIQYYGKQSQAVIAQAHAESDMLLYPCDPLAPTETGCITVMEAAAAGNVPVITDADCLPSEFSAIAEVVELPYGDHYLAAVYDLMQNPDYYMQLQKNGRDFAKTRTWDQVAKRWIKMFKNQKGS